MPTLLRRCLFGLLLVGPLLARPAEAQRPLLTVVVDPGHGGSNLGAPGFVEGVFEKKVTLALARLLRRRLERDGVTVIVTRDADLYLTLAERVFEVHAVDNENAIDVEGQRLTFTRAIIATGARAAVPSIPGLAEAGFLTNETVFSLTGLPARMAVVGAGPIGCELAQAFRRFGTDVTVIGDNGRLLPREDADASRVVTAAFVREGIKTVLDARVTRVDHRAGSSVRTVIVEQHGRTLTVDAEAVLVATGRAPNLEGLDLDKAGIASTRAGVTVDDRLRTSNARVWAVGDIASPYKFTHAADALARVALQNALFFGRKKASALVIPWATYTGPEVAHVGISAEDAAKRPDVRTLTVSLADNDRAVLDGQGVRAHAAASTSQTWCARCSASDSTRLQWPAPSSTSERRANNRSPT